MDITLTLKRNRDKLTFKLKRYFVQLLHSEKSEKEVATSFAIGTFISLMPTPGFCTLTGIAAMAIFKQLNKFAILLALALYNAFTIIPFYWVGMLIGQMIFHDMPDGEIKMGYVDQFYQYGRQFVVGTLLLIIPWAMMSYFPARWIVRRFRKKRGLILA